VLRGPSDTVDSTYYNTNREGSSIDFHNLKLLFKAYKSDNVSGLYEVFSRPKGQ
jgi:hypothetical protein